MQYSPHLNCVATLWIGKTLQCWVPFAWNCAEITVHWLRNTARQKAKMHTYRAVV